MQKGSLSVTRTVRKLQIAVHIVFLVTLFHPLGVRADGSLTAEQAKSHIGEQATVCGTVATAKFAATSRGQPTFLNLDQPYPHPLFTVVIWGTDRARFGAPEITYLGQRLCATGQIESYRGIPQIIVRSPAQLTVSNTTPSAPAKPLPGGTRAPAGNQSGMIEQRTSSQVVPGSQNKATLFQAPTRSVVLAGREDCEDDCRSTYESEADDCRRQYEDPDEADDLQSCIEDAKSTYDSCASECEDEDEEE